MCVVFTIYFQKCPNDYAKQFEFFGNILHAINILIPIGMYKKLKLDPEMSRHLIGCTY